MKFIEKKLIYSIPYLVILTPLIFLYFPLVCGNIPNYMDNITQFIPWRTFVRQSILSGEFPLWNQYQGCGVTVIGNPQVALFYPINLVIDLIFPTKIGFPISIFIHLLLGGVFFYLYLNSLKINKILSSFFGLIFITSGFLATKIVFPTVLQSFVWFPLILFCIELFLRETNYKNFIFLIISISLSIFSGYVEVIYYNLLFAFIYFIFCEIFTLRKQKNGFNLKITLLRFSPFVLGIGISLTQILPIFENLRESNQSGLFDFRSYLEMVNNNNYNFFDYLLNIVKPRESLFASPFIGVTVVLLILFVFINLKNMDLLKRNRLFINLGFLIFCILVLSQNKYISIGTYFIPFFKYGWPNNLLTGYFIFSALLISVISLDSIKKSNLFKLKRAGMIQIAVCILIFIEIFNNFRVQKMDYVRYEYLFENSETIDVVKKLPLTYRVIGVDGEDRYSYRWRTNYVLNMPNLASMNKVLDPQISDPVINKKYQDFVLTLSNFMLKHYPFKDTYHFVLVHPYDQRLLSALSVKYIISNFDLSLNSKEYGNNFRLIKKEYFSNKAPDLSFDMCLFLYENLNALPRVYVTDKVKSVNKIDYSFIKKRFNPDKFTIIEDCGSNEVGNNSEKLNYSITNFKSMNNEISLKVKTNKPSFLILTDNYFPGWTVEINGKREKIYRSNGSFRAIYLRDTENMVVFKYFPNSLKYGIVISVGTIVLLITLFFFKKKIFK